jgi:hypothetical protein
MEVDAISWLINGVEGVLRKAAWLASCWGRLAEDLLVLENNPTNAYSGQITEGTEGRGRIGEHVMKHMSI